MTMRLGTGFQTALAAVYPARCLTCGNVVDSDFGLCGACWRDTAFIGGAICDSCGVPLPGADRGERLRCDSCLATPRAWVQGRAALVYRDTGRKLVLALKHGDRQEIARPAALWMAAALRGCLEEHTLIAPVPLHWTRMLSRRYNQSALLARYLGEQMNLPVCADLLQRVKRTQSLDGLGSDARFAEVSDAIQMTPRRRHRMVGRPLLLVDDVMTSGATLAACTAACLAAGSGPVRVVTLARVGKDT